jgi:hypothetical protein
MDLLDLNYALYRCDQEERDEGFGGGSYEVPGAGRFVYCGLQGITSMLTKVSGREGGGREEGGREGGRGREEREEGREKGERFGGREKGSKEGGEGRHHTCCNCHVTCAGA